jgi:deoxycytidylate deaminase
MKESGQLVVGLTGPLGSGCSTIRKALVKDGFVPFCLSDYIRKEYEKSTGNPIGKASKKDLQDLGDKMRREKGTEYVAVLAKTEADKVEKTKPLVFDSIRNIGEVNYLRKQYDRFFLVAVDCVLEKRWQRIKEEHYLSKEKNERDFLTDEKRDKYDETTRYGQSVDLCVEDADIVINNRVDYQDEDIAIDNLRGKISPYIGLMNGDLGITPSPLEMNMAVAYTASLSSKCVKRRVGAVIVDEKSNTIMSVGYNENPQPIDPCIVKYKRCYRDHFKTQFFKQQENLNQRCPKCKEPIKDLKSPFLCKKCGCDLDKEFKNKKMDKCTALHAEEKALLNAKNQNIAGCTIYTTTFPCFTCAQKIVYSKLGSVVYEEAYPDEDSASFLDEAGIAVRRFEGIKAKAYFRAFGSWQKEIEEKLYPKKID